MAAGGMPRTVSSSATRSLRPSDPWPPSWACPAFLFTEMRGVFFHGTLASSADFRLEVARFHFFKKEASWCRAPRGSRPRIRYSPRVMELIPITAIKCKLHSSAKHWLRLVFCYTTNALTVSVPPRSPTRIPETSTAVSPFFAYDLRTKSVRRNSMISGIVSR